MTPAFLSFGFAELLLVGVVALLVFGGNLPDVMRNLGQSYAKFRQHLAEFSRPVREEIRQVTKLPPPDTAPVSSDDGDAPEYPDYDVPDDEDEAPDTGETTPASDSPSGGAIDEPPPV